MCSFCVHCWHKIEQISWHIFFMTVGLWRSGNMVTLRWSLGKIPVTSSRWIFRVSTGGFGDRSIELLLNRLLMCVLRMCLSITTTAYPVLCLLGSIRTNDIFTSELSPDNRSITFYFLTLHSSKWGKKLTARALIVPLWFPAEHWPPPSCIWRRGLWYLKILLTLCWSLTLARFGRLQTHLVFI